MVSTNDMRPGQSIIVDSQIYNILEYQHVKPGKGKAFVKTKLKNITSGGVVDKTFRADEEIEQAYIDKQKFQFLYKDTDDFVFMNMESFNQISILENLITDNINLLKPNQEVTISMYEETPIDIILPTTINLLVTKAEPAIKGDSVNSSTKEITCETGLTLQVPMFVNEHSSSDGAKFVNAILDNVSKNNEFIKSD